MSSSADSKSYFISIIIFFSLIFNILECRISEKTIVSNIWNQVEPISEFHRIYTNNYLNSNVTVSKKCDVQVQIFMTALKNFEPWALEMFDASSKLPSGLIRGNLKDLGMYDQCIAVNVTKNNTIIRGRHCMYTAAITLSDATTLPLSPTLSVCLPSACDKDQVIEKMQMLFDFLEDFFNGNKINVTSAVCSVVDNNSWNLGTIITIGVFGILIIFLIICTLCDLFIRVNHINNVNYFNTLSKFSLIVNGQRILNTQVPKDNLPVITGLRFYSMTWIILGHAFIMNLFGSVVNIADAMTWFRSWNSLYILIAPFAVDSFFVISGFLTSYLFIKEMAKGRKFNIFLYYIHRYIRLTPAFMAIFLIVTYLLPSMGSGALWDATMNAQSHYCKKNWWPMLLYVHNYVYKDGPACLGHTWYLAVDMQLFWLSPLIIYPLYKKPKIGLFILYSAIIASIITPAVIAGINKFTVALAPTSDLSKTQDMMLYFYIVTYTRAGPWLLGILLGYYLSSNRNFLPRSIIKLGWCLAIVAFAYSFFTYRIYQSENYEWNIYWETFNAGIARHVWAFGVCWIIYVSTMGHGGVLSKFLSLPIYLPFSRISYSVYLIHYVVQTIKASSARVPSFFSDYQMLDTFFSDLLICIVGGFIFSLLFESPFLVLEKLILGNKTSASKSNNHNNDTNKLQDEVQSNSMGNGHVNQGFENSKNLV
ncbi:O-acyltransferase like protein-like isoform X1 [Microplitis demolitor]|uniref:O-acyltransferase like protein-like isoform X1 n=1 Tax=Microplitis demolitor TaxID=69319 RepID=UPI0004CD3107|nr:O-acyltransferase like protein-like isoform X1 [Microplitis demolitor]